MSAAASAQTPRLLERYRSEITAKLAEEFGYANSHQVPTVTKVVVNMGIGEATANPKLLEKATTEMGLITVKPANEPVRVFPPGNVATGVANFPEGGGE